ncbi:MAG: hypothetical protein AMXMBFR33_03600 [Candidatus Xenobia bacterium]
MAVQRYQRNQLVYLLIPSDSHRDLGLFLVFLGLVGTVPGFYIINRLFLHWENWDWRLGGFVGLALVVMGMGFLLGTRKSFRVGQGEIRMKDGLFRRVLVYRWRETPRIRMRSVDEDRGPKPTEVFEVHLVDGHYDYLLDRRPGQQMESRTLAEMLAKAIGCPVMEKSRETGELTLEASELDLSFVERVKRHPVLLGPAPDEPVPAAVLVRHDGPALVLAWSSFNKNLLSEVLVSFGLLVGLEMLPFHGREDAPTQSVFDIMRTSGDYTGLYAQFGILAAVLLYLVGLRHEFRLEPTRVIWRQRVWGVTTRRATIPAQELEQISVRESSRGSFLQLISDRLIITRRLVDTRTASWLASTVRHYYVGQNS